MQLEQIYTSGLKNERNRYSKKESYDMLNIEKRKTNSSGIIGVSFWKRDRNWTACITVSYKTIRLGYFDTKIEAVKARYYAEKKYGYREENGRYC